MKAWWWSAVVPSLILIAMVTIGMAGSFLASESGNGDMALPFIAILILALPTALLSAYGMQAVSVEAVE